MRAEFWLESWVNVRDQEGRWLLEQGAPDYQGDQHVACPYADSRQGLIMNAGALEQVGRYWAEVCRRVRLVTPVRATLQQAFQSALELVCRPLLEDSPVSALDAATYKACVGFCQVFCWLALADEDSGRQSLAEFGDHRSFLQWLDGEGWLRGGHQVCAGSSEQIGALYRLFCDGQGAGAGLTPVVQAVALQAALLLSGAESRMLRAPWIYAITARPRGQPEWARHLLPHGHTSHVLETYLSQHTRTDRERLALDLLSQL